MKQVSYPCNPILHILWKGTLQPKEPKLALVWHIYDVRKIQYIQSKIIQKY